MKRFGLFAVVVLCLFFVTVVPAMANNGLMEEKIFQTGVVFQQFEDPAFYVFKHYEPGDYRFESPNGYYERIVQRDDGLRISLVKKEERGEILYHIWVYYPDINPRTPLNATQKKNVLAAWVDSNGIVQERCTWNDELCHSDENPRDIQELQARVDRALAEI